MTSVSEYVVLKHVDEHMRPLNLNVSLPDLFLGVNERPRASSPSDRIGRQIGIVITGRGAMSAKSA
jgi:hypothetical protein